mmetsp:Transcript_9023/g.12111  ORF Transcript_9023/g.12111 Transcript_9023/m.12111 type:complete len:87 (-) Transcript_9023:588-848(-)
MIRSSIDFATDGVVGVDVKASASRTRSYIAMVGPGVVPKEDTASCLNLLLSFSLSESDEESDDDEEEEEEEEEEDGDENMEVEVDL